jgi:hypothetical protein
MRNVYLFQPQYSIEFRKETNYYLPHSSGCLWSYAYQHADIQDNFVLKDIIFKRDRLEDVLDRMEDPVYCGFSCYIWNEQYCLQMAELIKQRWPKCIIQFGGPQAQSNYTKYSFIDSIVMGEGEEIFLDTLRSIIQGKSVELFYPKRRLQDLQIPSPYLTGVFDFIIKKYPDVMWAMSLETNRGCPYSCTFCDWGGTTYSKVKRFQLDKVAGELDWAMKNGVVYIFVADANFGIFKERDLEIARMIRHAIDNSQIESINIQYAKNSTDVVFEIAKIIGPYNRGITVAVQSMNDLTLDAIKRKNLEVNDIEYMMQLSAEHGVTTYTDLILGLPGETHKTWIDGLSRLLELGQHQNIEVWFAQLLPNAELANEETRRKYGIKTVMGKDFLSLNQSRDEANIQEFSEIVCSTNTLTTDELIDCYLYAWMIIHFHIDGYSQMIARYAQTVKDIEYKDFYNIYYDKIKSNTVLGAHYAEVRSIAHTYLTTGDAPENFVGGHALHAMSYKYIYDNKDIAVDLALETLSELTNYDSRIEQLQRAFIVDSATNYPCIVSTDYNVFSGKLLTTQYTFTPKEKNLTFDDFYILRRKGLIQNQLLLTESIK